MSELQQLRDRLWLLPPARRAPWAARERQLCAAPTVRL